jgi:hypothetical protein
LAGSLATCIGASYLLGEGFRGAEDRRQVMGGMDSALRRLNVEEPVSRLASASTRCARYALALAVLALLAAHARGALARFFAVLTFQPGALPDPGVGLFIFLGALAMGALALVLALGGAASIWIKGTRGIGRIVRTLLLLALLAPYPAWLVYSAGGLPPWLNDISTDIDDPPAFLTTADAVSGRGGWTPGPLDPSHADRQIAAYPDVKTIALDMEMDEAFKATHEALRQLRWKIVAEERPGGPKRPEGHIDALAFSPALNLPVAISIRLRHGDDETRVDMRAVTRYLPNDLGAGAKLIGKLNDALEAADENS